MEDFILRERPEAAIIELGSNDLCYGTPIQIIVDKLMKKLRSLLTRFRWLDALIWCQVTPRVELTYGHKNEMKYNEDVRDFNEAMRTRIRPIDRLHHWHHRGLAEPSIELFADDVHPTTTEAGRKKYLASMSQLCKWTRLNQAASASPSSSSSEDEERRNE